MRLNPFKDADLYDLEDNVSRFLSRQGKSFTGTIAALFKSIHKKGSEKITLMFIPHSEKRIINLHISLFSIVLTVILLSGIITTTTILIVNHTSTIKEINRLKLYGYDTEVQIDHYQKEIDNLYSTFQKFKPEITYLYSLTPDNYVDSLWAKGGVSTEESNAELPDMGEMPSDEQLNISEMKQELETTKEVLKQIKVFLADRKKVIENTPSIWPTDGYVTTAFGSNLSGKTDQVNFYPGVDIVTFPGAEIRSTAPGTVTEITWDEQFGITVKVRHKYGFSTVYSHCQRVTVKEEQKVSKGEIIGYVGKTGDTMRHKLFYQIKIGMEFVDPMPYLNKLYRSGE
jgi:murein DD-endopeptidase MepM/ murein hydrolase activator NlpD